VFGNKIKRRGVGWGVAYSDLYSNVINPISRVSVHQCMLIYRVDMVSEVLYYWSLRFPFTQYWYITMIVPISCVLLIGATQCNNILDKRMIKLALLIIFSKLPKSFDAWSFLLIHIRFTPSEGPKIFINDLLRKQTMKLDHGKRPSSMVRLHGPWCKLALVC
jgi:hypothetical protein